MVFYKIIRYENQIGFEILKYLTLVPESTVIVVFFLPTFSNYEVAEREHLVEPAYEELLLTFTNIFNTFEE